MSAMWSSRTASTPPRPAAALLLALSLATALSGCGGDERPEPSGPLPVVARPSLPSVADGVGQQGQPRVISLLVTPDRVLGVGDVVEVPLNTPVRLVVTAERADVLRVGGYDLRVQLTVDEPVPLSFVASRAGEFDVSLDGADRVLTRLRVS